MHEVEQVKEGRLPEWCFRRRNDLEKRVQSEVDKNLQLFWNAREHKYQFWFKGQRTGRWWCGMTIQRDDYPHPARVVRLLRVADLQGRDGHLFVQKMKEHNDAVRKQDDDDLADERYEKREAIVKEVEQGVYGDGEIDRFYYPQGDKPVRSIMKTGALSCEA